jgi:hypothetical protein
MKDRTLRLLPVRIGSSPHLEGYENRAGVDNIQGIECLNIRSVFPLVRLGGESALLVKVFGRSRPAADASREAVQRWLLDGLGVSVGHRRCSCDPTSQNDAGRTPAS